METKAAAKFAPLLASLAAEGLDLLRIEDLKTYGILQSADEMGALSAQKNSCHARMPHLVF